MRLAWSLVLAALLGAACGRPRAEAAGAEGARAPAGQLAELGFYAEDSPEAKLEPSEDGRTAEDVRGLVGTVLPEWTFAAWANGPALTLGGLRGRVVVIRFFTAGCPFCEASMPALAALAKELRDQPVTFVGAFHAKPARPTPPRERALALVKQWGVEFPIAFDDDWRTLRAWYLDGHPRPATSVTFVIDRAGRVAHVHPGPVYFPSSDPADAEANRDYLALRAAIERALGAPPP